MRLILHRFVEWHKEWVCGTLGSDVRCRTVSRKYAGASVEMQKLFEDVLHHEIVVAARMVGTSDCAGKECVAGEHDLFIALEEAEASD